MKSLKEFKRSFRLSKSVQRARESLALLVWCSIIVQLFVFDLGGYLASLVPGLEFVFRFRFLFILSSIGLFWLILGTRNFILLIGYIIAYPFIVIGWHIPRLLFKNWTLLIAFSPAIYSTIKNLRLHFILATLALVSAFLICLAPPNYFLLMGCMTFLGIYLVNHFIRRFRVAFSPSTVFADIGVMIKDLWVEIQKSNLYKPSERLNAPTEEYAEEYAKEAAQKMLGLYVLAGSLCFVAERLNLFVKSHKLDIYFLISLVYTFAITTLIFSLEYLGLERIAPGSFSGGSNLQFLDFLGFSFSTIMTSDISQLRPVSEFAQLTAYVQLSGSLLIIVLLVFVILTSIRERYRQDLDDLVSELRSATSIIDSLIEVNFELTVAAADKLIFEFNPTIMKWCLKEMRGTKHVDEISQLSNENSHGNAREQI